jgi:hypothetical protein
MFSITIITGNPISNDGKKYAEIAWERTVLPRNETGEDNLIATSAFRQANHAKDDPHPNAAERSDIELVEIGRESQVLAEHDILSAGNKSHEKRKNRKMKSEKERLRLELLKQIKSLDHMKCFPKVLCGLSVDSSRTSSGIDSHLVRSYIQLMRSAKP